MEEKNLLSPMKLLKKQALEELKDCNSLTLKYGLSLSEQQMEELVEKRFEALRANGRIEFGQGILKKLIYEFCDSPYLMQENYQDTLMELQDIFYFYKNEAMDLISDDELLDIMKQHFDGECQGSIEYLSNTTLPDLCRNTRYENRYFY